MARSVTEKAVEGLGALPVPTLLDILSDPNLTERTKVRVRAAESLAVKEKEAKQRVEGIPALSARAHRRLVKLRGGNVVKQPVVGPDAPIHDVRLRGE